GGQFGYGIVISAEFGPATGNLVAGNYIGTDITGTKAAGNFAAGVEIGHGATFAASHNTIGGAGANGYNILSGNMTEGVQLDICDHNLVRNNYIGTNANNSTIIGNGDAGVKIQNGASGNTIGGTGIDFDVISGNATDGVLITDAGTTDNLVR